MFTILFLGMKTASILVIAAVIVIGGVSAYAIAPYFTNNTIDEALPENIITEKRSENSISPVMLKDSEETMMMEKRNYYDGKRDDDRGSG